MSTTYLRPLHRRVSLLAAALVTTIAVLFGGLPADASSAGTISGVIFADMDRDGVRDPGESPFADHLLYLFDSSGNYVANTRSDTSGNYKFSGLASGTYTIKYETSTWSSIREDWVPTTTGSLLPVHTVSLNSSATADFGWRPIVKSTDISKPISALTGPEGLRVQSYNDVVSAQQIYSHMAAEFRIGPEAPTTIVRFAYGTSNVAQTSVVRSNGEVTAVHVTVYTSYVRWLTGGDYTLAHEYGHAWMNYHNFYVNQDDGKWTRYLTARGIDPNDERLGSSHGWMPGEIAAEDYRQLFASANARGTNQLNRDIPRPFEIEGFEEYLRTEWSGGSSTDDGATAGTTDGGTTDDGSTAGTTDDTAGSTEDSVDEPAPASPTAQLTVSSYKKKGVNHADLAWTDLDGTKFDVYRDGKRIKTTSATSYTDNTGSRGSPTFIYQVCSAGTDTCTPKVETQF